MARQRAQASVETVVLLPVLAILAVAAWQGLVAAWAVVSVQDAAHAGARAAMVGAPVRPAVSAALPARLRPGLEVARDGQRLTVTVVLHTLVPGFSPRLEASAEVTPQ
jgi:TadE-like protein